MSQDNKGKENFIGLNSTICIAAQDIHGLDTTGHTEITQDAPSPPSREKYYQHHPTEK